jgi:hypothetical protein
LRNSVINNDISLAALTSLLPYAMNTHMFKTS